MKYLKLIYQFPLFILYVLLTMEKRCDYMVGEERGMHVEKSKDVSLFIPGSTTEYTFNPNRKPERTYATWREFWTKWGWYK